MSPLMEPEEQEVRSVEHIELSLLLEGLYQLCEYDFRQYVRTSLRRRVLNRMKAEGLTTITALLNKVLHDSACLTRLLNDMSIRVTEMFRDPDFFAVFRSKVIPELRAYPEIRIWHAGCATGEEAYSMAIMMLEEGLAEKTRIYATDMNEKALEAARRGAFPLKQMQIYTRNYQESGGTKSFSEYYTTDSQYAYLDEEVKKSLIFAQHNLVTDGSFNEFHVILCRNVLIYFDHELQQHVHRLLYNSLSKRGFLGLGNKESIFNSMDRQLYEEFAPREKIYRKAAEAIGTSGMFQR
ncbi:protein-glutamate O-methyltransferase CheR [Paenibacillus oryzisoli]